MKNAVAQVILFTGVLLLPACFLFYPRIEPVTIRIQSDHRNLQLHVLDGSHERKEDGAIVVDVPSGYQDIPFEVRSGTQTGRFVARTRASTGPYGPQSDVVGTHDFGGGLWMITDAAAMWEEGKSTVIAGEFASEAMFIVGRPAPDTQRPLIDAVAPGTEVLLNPQTPSVSFTGRGGASVLAYVPKNPGRELRIYGPEDSSVLIEQEGGSQEIRVDRRLPVVATMRPGRAKIRWRPVGSTAVHVEVNIESVSDEETDGGRGVHLIFSSMLDK